MENKYREARILIVDDDPVSRSTMEEILKPEGYTVFSVVNGGDLLNLLTKLQPDVLLLDIVMPLISGLDLCRQIKGDKQLQHLPIILVTSMRTQKEIVTGLDSGADEFISKPVHAAELRARVRSMLRVKQRSDLLLRLARLREDMAHMAVHDLRTPISACMLQTDIMLYSLNRTEIDSISSQNKTGNRFKQSLLKVKKQLKGLNGQVEDILLLARNDEGELTINCELEDLSKIVRQVAADHQEIANIDRITLAVETPAAACHVLLDTNLVSRMIANLVSNAVKFSPSNSRVTIKVFQEDLHGSWTIDVMDEGPGVAPGDRHRIFDRYAVAETHSKRGRNYGLGLAFSKMVAEAHGGSIEVLDNQPRGAVFRVCLSNLRKDDSKN